MRKLLSLAGILLLAAGSFVVRGQERDSAAAKVLQRKLQVYASAAVRVKPAFVPLPAGAVRPKGWLKDWATSAANGITGHLDEYSTVYGEAWKGHAFEARGVEKDGTGWPLEQSSYWLDGAVRLASMIGDQPLMEKVRRRLDPIVQGVLNGAPSFIYWQPESVVKDGFNNWAHSQMGRALVAYYQATGDSKVLEALVKVYRTFPLPAMNVNFHDVSGVVNLDAMLETYAMSGDKQVLAHALEYTRTPAYHTASSAWLAGEFEPGHNVIFLENVRVPALLYPWTGNPNDLKATLQAIAWEDRNAMLPYGVGSGEEYHAGIGATRNTETCDVAAALWTDLWLLRITGKGDYSDRIEKAIFNAGPAPVARDFRTMCYYQSPNRYSAGNPREEPTAPGPESYRFTPIGHEVLCCVGNLNRIIPSYAMHMWMATLDGGLAATLYGPSDVETIVNGNVGVRIEEDTAYPFEESITFTVHADAATTFPLYLRIPNWSGAPAVKVNGRAVRFERGANAFVKIARTWHNNDRLEVRLPMHVTVAGGRETPYPQIDYYKKNRKIAGETGIHSPYASVYYGPLLFALPIPDLTPNQEAPGAHFNYALNLSPGEIPPAATASLTRRTMPDRWDWPLDAPLQLSVDAVEFDWHPTDLEPLPAHPVAGGKSVKVSLVPYGCTKFRVSMFPVTKAAWASRN